MAQGTSPGWRPLFSDLRPALDVRNKTKRRRRRRRMGDPATSTGRLAHLQKVFADEAADEARGSRENQPAGERDVTQSEDGVWDSYDSVRKLWHRKGIRAQFWHNLGPNWMVFESKEFGSAL